MLLFSDLSWYEAHSRVTTRNWYFEQFWRKFDGQHVHARINGLLYYGTYLHVVANQICETEMLLVVLVLHDIVIDVNRYGDGS